MECVPCRAGDKLMYELLESCPHLDLVVYRGYLHISWSMSMLSLGTHLHPVLFGY